MNMAIEMKQRQYKRQWDALPSSALVNIICRTSIKDRIFNLSLVCKSWSNASHHPHCWSSMIADKHTSSSAADDDFLKISDSFVDPFDGRRSNDPNYGIQALKALIGRAAAGASVTCLYFFPFLTSPESSSPNDDALLHLIAQHCPNLKHLSFHGSNAASEQAILEVICSCKKLEVVDFSTSPYFVPSVLEKMSIYCPNLRGIRRNGEIQPSFVSYLSLTSCFQRLKLLNLSESTIEDKDLLAIVNSLQGLEYLNIKGCQRLVYYMYIIKRASQTIPEFIYD